MGRIWQVGLVVLLVAAGVACDSENPAVGSDQKVEIRFVSQATVELYDVWDTEIDLNPVDGIPERLLYCEGPVGTTTASYPHPYAIQIEKIPGGSTVAVPLTDAAYATDAFLSHTDFDETLRPLSSGKQSERVVEIRAVPDPSAPVLARLSLTNGRQLSPASREYMKRAKIAAGTTVPGSVVSLGSTCVVDPNNPILEIGDANVAGARPPFVVRLAKGDTMIVKARKADSPPIPATDAPSFGSRVSLEGSPLAVIGRTDSTPLTLEGIQYFYTAR